MKTKRTIALLLCLVLALTLAACGKKEEPQPGQDDPYAKYPEKPLTLIVPYGAGGESDNIARPVAAAMADSGYTVVVQNIAGAGGNTGMMEVFNAPADGYTFALHMPETMLCYYASGDLPDKPDVMFDTLGAVAYDCGTISVNVASEFQTIQDLLDYAKAHPGELKFGSTASMGNNEFSFNLFCQTAGIEAQYVPYENASKARLAVMSGEIDVMMSGISSAATSHKNGEIRALCIGGEARYDMLPDTPTAKESGVDITWGLTRTFMVTKDTPKEVRDKLTEVIKKAFETDAVKTAYEGLNVPAAWKTAEDVDAWTDAAAQKYVDVYKQLTGK